MTRLYLVMPAQRLRETGVDRSFSALVAFAAGHVPEGALENVEQQGPIGFFPNNDTWASRIAGNDVVLIGDAAGAPDPTQGHGTALLFHDVRTLSELLLSESDWETAIEEFAERRRRAFTVIREVDRWHNVFFDTSAEAARLREGHARAIRARSDPGRLSVRSRSMVLRAWWPTRRRGAGISEKTSPELRPGDDSIQAPATRANGAGTDRFTSTRKDSRPRRHAGVVRLRLWYRRFVSRLVSEGRGMASVESFD